MISFFSFVSSSNQIGHYTNFSLTNIFRSHSIFLLCLSSSWSAMQSLVFSLYIWKPLQRGGPEASLSPFTSKHCQQTHLKSKTLPVTSISGMQKTFYQVLGAKPCCCVSLCPWPVSWASPHTLLPPSLGICTLPTLSSLLLCVQHPIICHLESHIGRGV